MKPFVEFESNPHRSFEVLKDFFEAFRPFADWKSKVTFSNAHEWMELGEEFSIPTIREHCLLVIENWLKAPMGARGDTKTFALQIVPMIGALEKFQANDTFVFFLLLRYWLSVQCSNNVPSTSMCTVNTVIGHRTYH